MHAYLIIAIVVCGIVALFDAFAFFAADNRKSEDLLAAGFGILNLFALIPAIVALALALAQ